jgi:ABC-type nitrate/sulfonate/bicarbonate transport system substrate-binding protein
MKNSARAGHGRQFLIGIGVALSALILSASFFACDRSDKKPPEKITLAYSATTDSVLAQVALIQGYYLQEGLDVTAHKHSYGRPALQEVLDGKADIATVAETPFMLAVLQGEKISIIATIQSGRKDNAIIARKDRNIHSPGDLKGRKIAASLGTTSDFFLDVFLSVRGIARKSITVVNVKPEELQNALVSGSVDAASTFIPWSFYTQKALGNKGIAFFDEDIYTFTFNIVAKQEFFQNNPGKVIKILRALIRAEGFTAQNPAEAQKLVVDNARVDNAIVREIWSDFKFNISLDQSLILALEDESQWAIDNKLTKATKVPNYLDFIYIDGLKSVKPEAVRILR